MICRSRRLNASSGLDPIANPSSPKEHPPVRTCQILNTSSLDVKPRRQVFGTLVGGGSVGRSSVGSGRRTEPLPSGEKVGLRGRLRLSPHSQARRSCLSTRSQAGGEKRKERSKRSWRLASVVEWL